MGLTLVGRAQVAVRSVSDLPKQHLKALADGPETLKLKRFLKETLIMHENMLWEFSTLYWNPNTDTLIRRRLITRIPN